LIEIRQELETVFTITEPLLKSLAGLNEWGFLSFSSRAVTPEGEGNENN
jgi:hypothetical protein